MQKSPRIGRNCQLQIGNKFPICTATLLATEQFPIGQSLNPSVVRVPLPGQPSLVLASSAISSPGSHLTEMIQVVSIGVTPVGEKTPGKIVQVDEVKEGQQSTNHDDDNGNYFHETQLAV